MPNQNNIERMLSEVCRREAVPGESRERILQNILASANAPVAVRAIWATPSFWAIVFAIIIMAIIIYGIWLPSKVALDLFG